MSLASRLPYDHAYADGYPGIGSQPLPTDADALDYLSRMATADGAGVEVGVAVAVDAFFRDTKAAGVFSALKASCILAGARTLAGALVPVVGDAPTNVANGFVSGDYSRTAGLTGDGTSYLDSGRANDDDPQNDKHNAAFLTSISGASAAFGSGVASGANFDYLDLFQGTRVASRSKSNQTGITAVAGMQSISRDNGANFQYRCSGESGTVAQVSGTPDSQNVLLLARNSDPVSFISEHTIAFYSIGTSVDLEALDTAVDNLLAAMQFHFNTGLNPAGYDADTIRYINAGYEAGGSLQ